MRFSMMKVFLALIVALMATVLGLVLFHYAIEEEHPSIIAADLTRSKNVVRSSRTRKKDCYLELGKGELSTCEISPLVHYWNTRTDCFESNLRTKNGLSARVEDRKYVVFQPDLGGWNNIRMSLEVTIVFALITGRILVLPPPSILYLLSPNKKRLIDNKTGVEDYIDFKRITMGRGVETMSMDEFIKEAAIPGKLLKEYPFIKDIETASIRPKELYAYLEQACYSRKWQPGKTFMAFNISSSSKIFDSSTQSEQSDRLRQFAIPGHDRRMYSYNKDMDSHRAIYFSGSQKNRLLTLFYVYFFFMRPEEERLVKRFVRDRIRYHDPIYCAGGKIAEHMALKADPAVSLPLQTMQRTNYVAYHIRRGDFQHAWVKIPAEEILQLTKSLIPGPLSERVVYIATDETKNTSFFDPFRKAFKEVYFLADFKEDASFALQHLPINHYGMVEQVICASADIFIGTPLSTFTGYITRMRGYMEPRVPGIYNRTYYYMKKHMYQLRDDPHFHVPFWPREFREAFEPISEPDEV